MSSSWTYSYSFRCSILLTRLNVYKTSHLNSIISISLIKTFIISLTQLSWAFWPIISIISSTQFSFNSSRLKSIIRKKSIGKISRVQLRILMGSSNSINSSSSSLSQSQSTNSSQGSSYLTLRFIHAFFHK